MGSSLTWLDFSERERRKALDVIEQFRDEDTRDELGMGTVRDALADLLFPGTSTIQTRARYFLFIPWIYLRLERDRVGYPDVIRRARQAEVRLMEALILTGAEGVIGGQSREHLQRLPSSIYWAGLRTWGILASGYSQDEHHRWLSRYYREIRRASGQAAEGDRRAATSANWHAHLPRPPEGFPEGSNFVLSPGEADYLADRISRRLHGSLIEFMVSQGVGEAAVPFPWLHPMLPALPQGLRRTLEQARIFSEVMHGASLLYNLLLAESREEFAALAGTYRGHLDRWWEEVGGTRRRLSPATLPELWETVRLAEGHRIPPRTRTFVGQWYHAVSNAPHVAAIADGDAARGLVRDRERQLKGARARIGNDRMLVGWKGSSGAAQLSYRWKAAGQIIEDIVTAR